MGTGCAQRAMPSKKHFANGKFMTLSMRSAGGPKGKTKKNVCDSEKVDSTVYDEMFTF